VIALLNLIDAVRYRLRHASWCTHASWTRWRIADTGRFRYRTCRDCGRWESG